MILKKCIWRKYEKEKTDNSSSNHLLCNIIHMAKEKRMRIAGYVAGCLVAAGIIGWAGYSGYSAYEANKPMETIYANLDSVTDYMSSLNAE